MGIWWTLFGATVAALAVFLWVRRPGLANWRQRNLERAQQNFRIQRERLEAVFLHKAANSGRPRGLRWTGCDFGDDVTYARERRHGALLAFVSVTISFEAIEGGPMEDVEAVGNLRAATAIFTCTRDGWKTDGRAVFNLEPAEAIARYEHEFELVGHTGQNVDG